MLSLRSLIILLGLIALAMACAPHMPKRGVKHGWCKFYVDGKSDFDSSRKKRDSGSGSGEGGGKKFNRDKKRKDKKCYEYEDGTKDDGAVLDKGVTYTVTITKS